MTVIDADLVVAVAVEGGPDLSYGDWERRSNAGARGLAGRGIGPGDRVVLRFDGRRWADYAVADLAVRKAGGVAVPLTPGATRADVARAVSDPPAAGVLCPPDLVPPDLTVWAAPPGEVGEGQDEGALPAPAGPALGFDGPLVHGWAPGSPAGRLALGHAAWGNPVTALAVFDPDRLGAAIVRRRAVACGLTPALAAALLAAGAPRRHDLSAVAHLLLSGTPSPGLQAALATAFPGAALVEVGAQATTAPAGAAPVAVSQEGMVWHEQFTPGSFNLPSLVRRYRGALDVAALEWAFSEMVRRHEPLRTTFEVGDGVARQVVGERTGAALTVVDLTAMAPGDRDAEAALLVAEATRRPFDLSAGPLFEPRLLRLGTDDHVVVVRLHHTVFDDWSVDVFRRELSALYGARVAGATSPLAEPATSYTAVSRRQQAALAGPRGDDQRAWWRRELAGAPLSTQLPAGEQAGPQPALRVDLPPALAAAVRALAPRLRATPYMTVLAAFSALLARITGQDDLVVATVVAHRDRSEVEPLIGCFTKKVPLRLRVDGDPTFSELVARTRASLLGALAHQDVAFDEAVRVGLGPAAAAHGVVPQVAVVFQAEAPQTAKLALPGLTIGPYDAGAGARQERHFSSGPDRPVDAPVWGDGIYSGTFLILSLLETADGMALIARGVFDRPAIMRLLEDLQSVLERVVAEPDALVSVEGAGVPDPDVVEVGGFRARRSRLEAALATCPGVASVELGVRGREPRLVASVVAGAEAPPTLDDLRHALWSRLPGTLWPAEADGVATPSDPHPLAVLLAAMWGELRGRPATPAASYWQDFSFLPLLAEARNAGLTIPDEHVVHCRTIETLAAAMRLP